jgi:hypothetical protein
VILPTVLAAIGPFAAIYPKEAIDASGDGPLREPGPRRASDSPRRRSPSLPSHP